MIVFSTLFMLQGLMILGNCQSQDVEPSSTYRYANDTKSTTSTCNYAVASANPLTSSTFLPATDSSFGATAITLETTLSVLAPQSSDTTTNIQTVENTSGTTYIWSWKVPFGTGTERTPSISDTSKLIQSTPLTSTSSCSTPQSSSQSQITPLKTTQVFSEDITVSSTNEPKGTNIAATSTSQTTSDTTVASVSDGSLHLSDTETQCITESNSISATSTDPPTTEGNDSSSTRISALSPGATSPSTTSTSSSCVEPNTHWTSWYDTTKSADVESDLTATESAITTLTLPFDGTTLTVTIPADVTSMPPLSIPDTVSSDRETTSCVDEECSFITTNSPTGGSLSALSTTLDTSSFQPEAGTDTETPKTVTLTSTTVLTLVTTTDSTSTSCQDSNPPDSTSVSTTDIATSTNTNQSATLLPTSPCSNDTTSALSAETIVTPCAVSASDCVSPLPLNTIATTTTTTDDTLASFSSLLSSLLSSTSSTSSTPLLEQPPPPSSMTPIITTTETPISPSLDSSTHTTRKTTPSRSPVPFPPLSIFTTPEPTLLSSSPTTTTTTISISIEPTGTITVTTNVDTASIGASNSVNTGPNITSSSTSTPTTSTTNDPDTPAQTIVPTSIAGIDTVLAGVQAGELRSLTTFRTETYRISVVPHAHGGGWIGVV